VIPRTINLIEELGRGARTQMRLCDKFCWQEHLGRSSRKHFADLPISAPEEYLGARQR
jgi:hypothetical protein